MNPVLDFGEHSDGDITATVLVTGPARNPEIALARAASRGDHRDHLGRARLALGVPDHPPVDAIAESPASAAATAASSRVRRTVARRLDIQQNATGGTTISVGKQLTDKVHVGVANETDGSSSITLTSTSPAIQGGSRAAANGAGSVGLSFEKEY
jgi:autotransporter translocation and assembly factor TamB